MKQIIRCQYIICINKSVPVRIIIPASEIIQPCFFVEHIPSIAEGVQFTEGSGQGAGGGEGLTPSVVGVGDDFRAGIIDEGDDVALQVMDVGVLGGGCAVVPFQDGGFTGGVVEEVKGVLAVGRLI